MKIKKFLRFINESDSFGANEIEFIGNDNDVVNMLKRRGLKVLNDVSKLNKITLTLNQQLNTRIDSHITKIKDYYEIIFPSKNEEENILLRIMIQLPYDEDEGTDYEEYKVSFSIIMIEDDFFIVDVSGEGSKEHWYLCDDIYEVVKLITNVYIENILYFRSELVDEIFFNFGDKAKRQFFELLLKTTIPSRLDNKNDIDMITPRQFAWCDSGLQKKIIDIHIGQDVNLTDEEFNVLKSEELKEYYIKKIIENGLPLEQKQFEWIKDVRLKQAYLDSQSLW